MRAIALGLLLTTGTSCGASDALRVSYATAVASCIATERAIVDREGTTADQDATDLAAARAACDATLEEIGR